MALTAAEKKEVKRLKSLRPDQYKEKDWDAKWGAEQIVNVQKLLNDPERMKLVRLWAAVLAEESEEEKSEFEKIYNS